MFSKTILTHILYTNKCPQPHFHPWAEWALCLSLTLTMVLFVYYQSSAVVEFRTFHTAICTSSVELKASSSLLPVLDKLLSYTVATCFQVEVGCRFQCFLSMLSACDKNLCVETVIRTTQIEHWKLNKSILVLNGTVWEDCEFAIIWRNGAS